MTTRNRNHQHVPGNGASRFRQLRDQHRESGFQSKRTSLTLQESKELMLLGNDAHVQALKQAGIRPESRFEALMGGGKDVLVIACSDARVLRLDSETDTIISSQIRVAGNIVPSSGASRDEIIESASRIRKGGLLVIEAHGCCGAVAEFKKWTEGGKGETGAPSLDALFDEIGGTDPVSNAKAQARKAREFLAGSGVSVGAVLYDWSAGTVEVIEGDHPMLATLREKWAFGHTMADRDGTLGARLASQVPHAVVIGSNDLPYSLATIMHYAQNEVFSTTGSAGGLDLQDEGSILYAVEHLHQGHVAFVATGTSQSAEAMFGTWEKDMRSMTVGGKSVISDMIDSGKLQITRLYYDLSDGRLREL